jgi:lactoylglutathione lyase
MRFTGDLVTHETALRTLHVGLRVSDLTRSLAFYTAVGYTVAGSVEGTPFGTLTMLRLPDDGFVTIELVQWLAGPR